MVVDEVIVHRNDNVDITLAIPIENEPTTEDSVIRTNCSKLNNFRNFTLRFVLDLPDLALHPVGRWPTARCRTGVDVGLFLVV